MLTMILLIFSMVFQPAILQSTFEELARIESYQSCYTDRDCKENSFCFGNDDNIPGRCKCEEHFIINRNRTFYECLETVQSEGSVCTRNLQCQYTLGTLSECISDICVCPEGTHLAPDNKCYKSTKLEEICLTHYNCLLSDGTYGFCVAGRCVCNYGQHPSTDKTRCVESVGLGEGCSNDDSCSVDFAVCYGVCKCIAGFIESPDNTACLKAANTFGDNCTKTVQCSAYLADTFCDQGSCVCRNGYHGYGNRCFLSARLGSTCTDKRQCAITPELERSVDCIEGVCICSKGLSSDNSYGCVLISNGNVKEKTVRQFIFITAILFIIILNE
ncbi:multiple epidermal growth factor-like domains protein 10 [Agrilus planipennis]|uniref:Multiple epidermal growth factor-like domains protein 10 n=1 Tax=Agrilus planipennis TaxID=224129 RepID=A0A1W4WTN5_AGRPL|nr:multiple epidermal growth factor-like domains protein 10 [Agrilus planipennis]